MIASCVILSIGVLAAACPSVPDSVDPGGCIRTCNVTNDKCIAVTNSCLDQASGCFDTIEACFDSVSQCLDACSNETCPVTETCPNDVECEMACENQANHCFDMLNECIDSKELCVSGKEACFHNFVECTAVCIDEVIEQLKEIAP